LTNKTVHVGRPYVSQSDVERHHIQQTKPFEHESIMHSHNEQAFPSEYSHSAGFRR